MKRSCLQATARPRRLRNQSGQAMTEFVIGTMLFLLPLFLILPMLGKYADVKAATAQSARYVAWERTVWFGGDAASVTWPGNYKKDVKISNEAHTRVVEFGRTLKSDTTANGTSGFTQSGARALWRNRDGSSMLRNYDDVATAPITNSNSPDSAAVVLDYITDVTSILGFDLETKGLYAGKVSISVASLAISQGLGSKTESFNPGTLTFSDTNVILANGWSANGSGHVKSMTAGVAPLGLLDSNGITDVVNKLGCVAMALFAPEICSLELGKLAPDVVPPDRLTN
ncbi:MAG: hypothetical protein ACAH12_06130 [Methylophilaceae bacterium]